MDLYKNRTDTNLAAPRRSSDRGPRARTTTTMSRLWTWSGFGAIPCADLVRLRFLVMSDLVLSFTLIT